MLDQASSSTTGRQCDPPDEGQQCGHVQHRDHLPGQRLDLAQHRDRLPESVVFQQSIPGWVQMQREQREQREQTT